MIRGDAILYCTDLNQMNQRHIVVVVFIGGLLIIVAIKHLIKPYNILGDCDSTSRWVEHSVSIGRSINGISDKKHRLPLFSSFLVPVDLI